MKQQRLSDQIAEKLEAMIADGSLMPGEKLPAERDLAHRLEVSRPSLREAIQKMNSKGLLTTRHGGGTYVCEESLEPSFVSPLIALLSDMPESRYDVLEIRHALEGTAAYYAALRSTGEDKEKIKRCFDVMIKNHGSPDPMDEARADAAFHLSIVEASHNVVLLHVMRGLFTLLQSSISHNLDKLYTLPRVFEPLSNQHERLMNATVEGDAERARQAAQEHLVFVEESLQQIDREEVRKQRALRGLTG
ncbi:MAG: FCD domain-containing protein [Sedimenticola sp.]|uniref:Pyruvate dehydrogenase complex repressor n=1 Tax=Sedimenticola thiotaurini TaxID=1543721 RepID=A0A558CTH8_9GAMM|nr:FCD domain-containing protein [Sedimenticola sp.]TVT52081.1 MAG: FCD domain-containing protein [Sedimenticola thiotaurini]MCW8882684.1 FCD domain-containing protein [Sedimenticola sp.]MCW8921488.1 FCD domain-containing protein [Sedimenticola sp.]MCW8947887.1 FCD domain-containing protein [Sedimenticola sp.]